MRTLWWGLMWLVFSCQAAALSAVAAKSDGATTVVSADVALRVDRDIEWARPAGQPLRLDIYQASEARGTLPQLRAARLPDGTMARAGVAPNQTTLKRRGRPVLVMFHGGGWLINDRQIMREAASYLAQHSNLLVVNVDYRLLGAANNSTRLDQIVNDALGAVVWVRQHIADYGGDPTRLAVTGDSAGAHLAAMVLYAPDLLAPPAPASDQAATQPLRFWPTGVAETQPIPLLQQALQVQAAVLSYGVFDVTARAEQGFETASNGFWQWAGLTPRGLFGPAITVAQHRAWYDAVSPLQQIKPASERRLPPQLLHVGTRDTTTPVAAIYAYAQALQRAAQPVQVQVFAGLNHAYLDNGCNQALQMCFARDAIEPLQQMLLFLQNELGD